MSKKDTEIIKLDDTDKNILKIPYNEAGCMPKYTKRISI